MDGGNIKVGQVNVMLTSFGGAQDGISAGGETKKPQRPSKAPSTFAKLGSMMRMRIIMMMIIPIMGQNTATTLFGDLCDNNRGVDVRTVSQVYTRCLPPASRSHDSWGLGSVSIVGWTDYLIIAQQRTTKDHNRYVNL